MSTDTKVHLPSNLSRYGEVTFHLEKTRIIIEQVDGKTEFESPNPRIDLMQLILEFNHRDKSRIFVNKAASDIIGLHHRNSKSWDSHGYNLTLSNREFGKSAVGPLRGKCSWSKNSLELVRSLQPINRNICCRLFLSLDKTFYDGISFKVPEFKFVTWKTRNEKFDRPMITLA